MGAVTPTLQAGVMEPDGLTNKTQETDVAGARSLVEQSVSTLVAAVAAWARAEWPRLVESAIAADPTRVKANQGRLGALKQALAELEADAASIVETLLEPWCWHRTLGDDELAGLVRNDRWTDSQVSLPHRTGSIGDEPLRQILGRVGPPLAQAGVIDESAAVGRSGRYGFALPTLPSELQDAIEAHDEALRRLALAAYEWRTVKTATLVNEAKEMWDNA